MPKRILHLRGSSALLGAERVVLELSQWSPEFGYESVIAAPVENDGATPEFIEAARADGIEAHTLPCAGKLDLGLVRRLRELVRTQAIDLIHCHGYKEDFYAAVAGLGVPLVATNHLWKRTTRALKAYCWLDGLILRRFDHVVAVSDPILADLRQAGVREDRLCKIPNGIDTSRFQPAPSGAQRRAVRDSLGLRADGLVMGMLSSLTPEKGHRYAIDAMATLTHKFPDLQLCVVGDGPLRQALVQEVARRGLAEQVVFSGRRSDIAAVLGSFDAFLLPSLNEGLPMALLEAMAAGLPAVASDVGDVGQAIEDGVSGRLVVAGDAAPLAQAVGELLADQTRRTAMGAAARERIAQSFSSRAMAKTYCRLYDRQLQPRAAHALGEA